MRQDPFFKHHLRTHLSQYAEEMNLSMLNSVDAVPTNPDDFIKFDRINLFDFRRTLPMSERQPKLDEKGRAWGVGKRKNAMAIANSMYMTAMNVIQWG